MKKAKEIFDRTMLEIKPLKKRKHELSLSIVKSLDFTGKTKIGEGIRKVASRIIQAKKNNSAIILMAGAHIVRAGVQNYLIDLMKRGYVSCVATNGAGMIHDFEFALIGATTEKVAHYIKEGQFGLWKETAQLNDIINDAYRKDPDIGMGEAVGRFIEEENLPYKSISILACAYRLHIPATVHVGIGYDIIHEHPNCSGAATGALSYNDFLKLAFVVQDLENGVVMNFGSAVMAPEVFLKALSMARNALRKHGREIKHFTTLVCDLMELPEDIEKEPSKDNARYYYRPLKTMLIRTVADGGEGIYVRGSHGETIPALWFSINQLEKELGEGS